jgi:hypothetical protein
VRGSEVVRKPRLPNKKCREGPNNAGSNQIVLSQSSTSLRTCALALGPPDSLIFTLILDDLMDRTLGESLLE